MAAHKEHFRQYALSWQAAGHGEKDPIVTKAAAIYGISKQTVYRKFKEFVDAPKRKRRSDHGATCLSEDELLMIAASAAEHTRKNGKMIQPLAQNVEILRANGLINAERICQETGEVKAVSVTTINRALRANGLHPKQLVQPLPATRLASEYPNHVWQIDPSRCVMAYLPQTASDNGLRIMDEKEYYKNKPRNQIKAIKHALWRYVIVDHASGWIYVEYVLGGETAENITNVFMNAMLEREQEVMHGVPKMVMLDAGSANTSALFKNLCKSLRVHPQVNKPGNPRSKGAVEKGNDIVERNFESMLKTLPASKVQTLEQINALATIWRKYFNSTAVHSRHRMTRNGAWLKIQSDQLIIAPPLDVMKELAVTAPEERRVSTFLTVSYKGKEYDVSDVPGVMVGEKLAICRNPSRELSMQAIIEDADGNEHYYVLPAVVKNEFGFDVTAPVIGQTYASKGDTLASANLKRIELLATGTETLEEAEVVRKEQNKGRQKGLFGGQYDPLAAMKQAEVIPHLPRQGIEHELKSAKVVMPMLTTIQAAKQLRIELGEWTPRHYSWLNGNYPDGVREDEILNVAERISIAMSESNVLPFRRVG